MLLCFVDVAAPTVIYTLSLHDALPIFHNWVQRQDQGIGTTKYNTPSGTYVPDNLNRNTLIQKFDQVVRDVRARRRVDRKSTRLNSSHLGISYAVFCLKKKNKAISYKLQ